MEFKSASVTACDISLQIPGFWVCWHVLVPLLWQPWQSQSKIHILVPKTCDYPQSDSVDSLRDMCDLSQDFAFFSNDGKSGHYGQWPMVPM